MNVPKQKNVLLRLPVLSLFFFCLIAPLPLFANEDNRPTLSGEVAYGEPIKFDYDQDGSLNEIQIWATLEIKPAKGKKGTPGHLPEEGYVRRYMKDLALGAPVIGYSQFNMLPDNRLGDKVPASEIKLTGNTATFMSGGLHYTIVDGGPGISGDTIRIDDGIRQYPVSLFDGNITISNIQNNTEEEQ